MYYRRRNSWFSSKLLITSAAVICVGLLLIAIPQLVRSVMVVATYPIVHIRNIAVTAVQPFFQTGDAEKDAVIAALRAELDTERTKDENIFKNDSTETDRFFGIGTSTDENGEGSATSSLDVRAGAEVTDVSEHDDDYAALGEVVFAPPYSITDRLVIRLGDDKTMRAADEVGNRVYVKINNLYLPVGTIESADAVTAAVLLYSFADRPVLVRFGTSTTIHTVTGYGGGVLSGQLPKALTIDHGEPAYLVQDGQPVFFGGVRYVERDDSNPLDRVFISLPISPASLSQIYVERT